MRGRFPNQGVVPMTPDPALIKRVEAYLSDVARCQAGETKGNEHALDLADLRALLAIAQAHARLLGPDPATVERVARAFHAGVAAHRKRSNDAAPHYLQTGTVFYAAGEDEAGARAAIAALQEEGQ